MKKLLLSALIGVLFFNTSFAYTESEVNDKVEQLENVVNKVFSNSTFKKKYAPIFKKTFESCAKSCKDEVNKQASIRIRQKYYSNFYSPVATEQDVVALVKEETETVKETKQEEIAEVINLPVTIEMQVGETKTAHYTVSPFTAKVSREISEYPEGITESQKKLVSVKYKTNGLFDIIVDENAMVGSYEIIAKSGDRYETTSLIVREKTQKCGTRLGGPDGMSLDPGETKTMRFSMYGRPQTLKWSFIEYPEGISESQKNKVHIGAVSSDNYTYKIELSADSDAMPGLYLLKAESDCGFAVYSISI